MTRLKHSILIERPLDEVYGLARQVERYPEFLPGYMESRIVERQADRLLLKRKAVLRGKVREWSSWVTFKDKEAIDFEHAAGPLQGTRVQWSFTALSLSRTRLDIVHDLQVTRPPLLRGWLEKFIFKPQINELADSVINAFKRVCERIPEGVA